MAHTDSINSKDGKMPLPLQMLYRMFLLYNGFVSRREFRYGERYYDPNSLFQQDRFIEEVDIIGNWRGTKMTMRLTIDHTLGFMDFQMEQGREYQPIYTLGSSDPVEYMPSMFINPFKEE